MKKSKLLFIILCGVGGGMIGYFVTQLSQPMSPILVGVGAFLLVFSLIMVGRKEKPAKKKSKK